jgi:hypothetical protein
MTVKAIVSFIIAVAVTNLYACVSQGTDVTKDTDLQNKRIAKSESENGKVKIPKNDKNTDKQKKDDDQRNNSDKARTERPAELDMQDFIAEYKGSSIAGRPTNHSVAIHVISEAGTGAYIEYGTEPGKYTLATMPAENDSGRVTRIAIDKLTSDTKYYYRVRYRMNGESGYAAGSEKSFHTAREAGNAFSFGVQGDSHPERPGKMFSADLYGITMNHAKDAGLDFYITLGDDFSIERLIEKNIKSQEAVDSAYFGQWPFLSGVGGSCSLYLVNGNHEQAAKYLLDGTADNFAVMAATSRVRIYPLPAPDSFYGGDAEKVERIGLLRDYYSWEWSDALFMVLDPYWQSSVAVDNVAGDASGKRKDLWDITLGDAQYKLLASTLAGSKAKYKFVFSHHVLGTGRGGIEMAGLYEWGGKNEQGVREFEAKRPGWAMPIHELFVAYKVSAFFQGHDHLFAYQTLDGVAYQSLPNPADDTYSAFNADAYKSGTKLPNSGFVRVSVAPDKATVEYVRSYLAKDVKPGHPDGEAAFSYEVKPSN